MQDVLRRSFAPLACAATLLPGCPATGSGVEAPAPGPSGVLAAVRRTETSHHGMGATVWCVTVLVDGAVAAEREVGVERASLRCPPLDPAALAGLVESVRVARAAGLDPRYDRSALPEPQANYSRHRTVVLGDGTPIEVDVEGWADVPPELAEVEQRLDAASSACTEEPGPPSDDGGCYVSDPTDLYRSVRLCLGPPEAPVGGFVLRDAQAVPDATLSTSWTGTAAAGDDGLILRAQRSRSQTVNEQVGTIDSGPEEAASRKWRLDAPEPTGERVLRADDGSEVILHPE